MSQHELTTWAGIFIVSGVSFVILFKLSKNL